jgi:hypothetical protein
MFRDDETVATIDEESGDAQARNQIAVFDDARDFQGSDDYDNKDVAPWFWVFAVLGILAMITLIAVLLVVLSLR